MSDRFQPITMEQLTDWVFGELEQHGSIFGIPRQHFFEPSETDRFRTTLYGQPLETPFGVAAGPHSQMAQNLIVAWLCGARFLELKTVQTLDELEVAKPCIDMLDEGYNVEWSQELKVDQSFDEYLRAWVLIHALHRHLGLAGDRPGVIFNMSVGYNLEGIEQPNVQGFLARMADGTGALEECLAVVARRVPSMGLLEVPARVSDNVTVSTMHGCPPEEIGKICSYLMTEWGLHTNVKLNPTLLGPERVRQTINSALGFTNVTVPDEAFGHDLKYADALVLLRELTEVARGRGVVFGVKLCNTLEVVNDGRVFDARQSAMMYLSGRPHHALAVQLAQQLSEEFAGRLLISFAGGADAWNVVDLLSCGMKTVTTCSDLLKPGGYGRLLQYLEHATAALEAAKAESLDALVLSRAASLGRSGEELPRAALGNLQAYARRMLDDRRLKRSSFERQQTKTARPLGFFDCVEAPCVDTCPIDQQVPRYISRIQAGEPAEAAAVIREDNALAAVLGRACNHACELTCVRAHYDEAVAIRELKRYAMDHEAARREPPEMVPLASVAVVGGGPCGLSLAYFLGRAGYEVTIFEASSAPGGMVSSSIPAYRATSSVLEQDLSLLADLGVSARLGARIGETLSLARLRADSDFVVLAAGAQRGLPLGIPGEEAEGVLDGLKFLVETRRGEPPTFAEGPIGVIGGGDVAMDCARTANRLAPGRVRLIYRRTIEQLPAHREEREALLEEGIGVLELMAPTRVLTGAGRRLEALECQPMELGERDASGRRRPVEAAADHVVVPLGTLIVAIGQQPDLTFLAGLPLELTRKGYLAVDGETLETSEAGLFAGGDLVGDGPATIVKALGDGKRIAGVIRARVEGWRAPRSPSADEVDELELWRRRCTRVDRVETPRRELRARQGFEEIIETFTDEAALAEAARCLRCDLKCSICVTVCPNRAISEYRTRPLEVTLPVYELQRGNLTITSEGHFVIGQEPQVAVVTDLCNECGNCATFCPTAGAPFRDKPRFYLNREEFAAQVDNAFLLRRDGAAWTLLARAAGETHELRFEERLFYSSPWLRATLEPQRYEIVELEASPLCPEGRPLSFELCLTMATLLSGARHSLSYLPFPDDAAR